MTITPPAIYAQTVDEFFYAIGTVESGHDDNAVGDGGASIGRYQIQKAYWLDATEYDKTIGGRYEDVRNPAYARRVMVAYFKRYARQAWEAKDWQTLARIHNGGPRGHEKQATVKYWEKVKKELDGVG
jgi:hypothetical protein